MRNKNGNLDIVKNEFYNVFLRTGAAQVTTLDGTPYAIPQETLDTWEIVGETFCLFDWQKSEAAKGKRIFPWK